LAAISNISCLVILAVMVVVAFPLRTDVGHERGQMRLLRIGMSLFLLGALNDIAVSLQLYPFFYLMEIAYLGLILVVTWGTSNAVVELASTRAELRRKHVRLQRIFENINEVYFETTLDGVVREISPSIARIAGLSPEVRGQSMLGFYVDVSRREELLRLLKVHGRVSNFDVQFRVACGEVRDADISAVLVRDEETGEPLVLGSIRDVTAHRRAETAKLELERKLQQAQKLESLGVLAGGIAHDFNNLLSGIMGSSELVKLKLGSGHPLGEMLDISLQSSRRAAELCRLMLAYSGRGRFVVAPVDLSDAVRAVRELLAVSVAKQTFLEYRLAEQALVVEADATQLNQVLVNLVMNASEALPKGGGRVTVSTRDAECSIEQLRSSYIHESMTAGRYAILEVRDNGTGMDGETKQKLFEPFFSTKFSGRGLGLAAVLGIVRAHRGTIQVESALGQGSLFRVFIPLCGAKTSVPVTVVERDSSWQGQGEVLVIDDESAVCETTAQMLELLGYRSTTTTDPLEGVAMFELAPRRFQLVVVDVTMPVLSGEEVLARLRQLQPGLPAVVISGYCEDDVLPNRSRDRWTGFLQKPFTLDTLREQTRRVTHATAAN
jgi:PAS domain S-box-containing protein